MTLLQEPNEDYHSSEATSKSKLWTLYTKTPFHMRFVERKPSTAFDFGSAAHTAILEPELLEQEVYRGPVDRRGNKWKEAMDFAEYSNMVCLTESDFDAVMVIRDLADTIPQLRLMREGDKFIEMSCYAHDEEFNVPIKCRPDLFNVRHGLMADIKNMASADDRDFARDVFKFGYHVQDAAYQDIWNKGAPEYKCEGFFFIAFEKCEPPTVALYELDAAAVAEGYAIYRKALQQYAACVEDDHWPSYPQDIQRIGLRSRYDYRETEAPEG